MHEKICNLVTLKGNVDKCNNQVKEHNVKDAELSIPRVKRKRNAEVVPWWNAECS